MKSRPGVPSSPMERRAFLLATAAGAGLAACATLPTPAAVPLAPAARVAPHVDPLEDGVGRARNHGVGHRRGTSRAGMKDDQ